jgi:hypothetical protein
LGVTNRPPQAIAADIHAAVRRGERLPFASVRLCPACLCPRAAAKLRYVTGPDVIGPGLMRSSGEDPRLVVTCGACGFEWFEEPAWT